MPRGTPLAGTAIKWKDRELALVHEELGKWTGGNPVQKLIRAQKVLPIDRHKVFDNGRAIAMMEIIERRVGPIVYAHAGSAPKVAAKPTKSHVVTEVEDAAMPAMTHAEAHRFLDMMGPGYVRAFKLID